MNQLPVVILAAALPLAAQQQPAPKNDNTVDVEIVVGEHKNNLGRCAKGGDAAHTIFIDSDSKKEVHHCVDKSLHNHGDHQTSQIDGAVRVAAGQRIRWFSNSHDFTVVSVVKPTTLKNYQPQDERAPNPLFEKFNQAGPREVYSPVVRDVLGKEVVIRQLYKTTFDIKNIGLIDPDVVCSM